MPGQQKRGHLVAGLGVGQRPAVLVARLEQHLEQVTGCLPARPPAWRAATSRFTGPSMPSDVRPSRRAAALTGRVYPGPQPPVPSLGLALAGQQAVADQRAQPVAAAWSRR